MSKIILRIYKTPEDWKQKHNLICNYRYVFYDYTNKILTSAGIPEHLNKKDFVNNLLKNNKHTFKRTKYAKPLF